MNLIAGLIAFLIFCVVVMGIVWVGFYVVLPIVLFFMLVSAVLSLVKGFVPEKYAHDSKKIGQKNEENQIIDVEYEEIK